KSRRSIPVCIARTSRVKKWPQKELARGSVHCKPRRRLSRHFDPRSACQRGSRRGRALLGETDEPNPPPAGSEGEATVLQVERLAAEHLEAPAGKGANRRVVGGGDHFEIVGIGDELLGDTILLAAQLEEDAQQ